MSLQTRSSNQSFSYRNIQCALDVFESIKLWKLACSMAWLDIKLRYKGSLLGPLWMTCTSGVTILMIGIIYSSLFNANMRLYLPFISISLILWQNAFSNVMTDGCQCFLQSDTFIHSLKLPFFLQTLRTVIRNLITLTLNLIIPLLVFLYYQKSPGWIVFLSLPGIFLWFINALSICLFLGCICARFRDMPQIINSIIQIVYYLTPIMWMPSQIHHYQSLLLINPFYSIMQVIKGPVLGDIPALPVYYSALAYSMILWGLAWFAFVRSKVKLAFWI